MKRRALVAFSTAAAVTSALSLRRRLGADPAPPRPSGDVEALRLRMEQARRELLRR